MALESLEIGEGIYWVGALDWEERDFHSFEIVRGLTYNAYLIIDDKITLVDTVKNGFLSETVERTNGLVDLSQLDYIVVNHIEPDHSGSLAQVKDMAPNAEIICTKKAKEGLCRYFDCSDWKFTEVGTGDEINTGKKTLKFVEMTMLHWPDSMATYVKEDNLLLSNDAFGQHIASVERYDDELGVDESLKWAKIYYANILMPFANLVKKKLKEIEELGIKIDVIAPSHGVIWRNPDRIMEAYSKWASFESEDKLVIVYDTIYESTAKLAREIADGARSKVNVRLFHARNDLKSEMLEEILDAKAVAIGSPTMHNRVYPSVAEFLTYLRGLKPRGKLGVAFGSYGWGGGAVREINKFFEELKWDTMDSFTVKYRPDEDELKKAYELGEQIAQKIKSS
ncbi:MAG: FprA family A-type flavoprotein [Archaeoglobaceae archaeon]